MKCQIDHDLDHLDLDKISDRDNVDDLDEMSDRS